MRQRRKFASTSRTTATRWLAIFARCTMSGCAVGGADLLTSLSAIPARTFLRNATAVLLCFTPSSIVELRRSRRRNNAFAWMENVASRAVAPLDSCPGNGNRRRRISSPTATMRSAGLWILEFLPIHSRDGLCRRHNSLRRARTEHANRTLLNSSGWRAGENGGLIARRTVSALSGIRSEVGAWVKTSPDTTYQNRWPFPQY